jgi:hypothetical protein
VFSFLSGLYFRGKLAYATAFSRPPAGVAGTLVITPSAGLLPPEQHITRRQLVDFSEVDLGSSNPRFHEPFLRDANRLAAALGSANEVVLLGSIATGKYIDVLVQVFGSRLRFPAEFVGRGDMSRGGLMLRCARSGVALDHVPIAGAVRRGPRPPRLSRVSSIGRR